MVFFLADRSIRYVLIIILRNEMFANLVVHVLVWLCHFIPFTPVFMLHWGSNISNKFVILSLPRGVWSTKTGEWENNTLGCKFLEF